MSKKMLPENAIDKFFFLLKQKLERTLKTIKESETLRKTWNVLIVKPFTSGPISIVLGWFLVIIFLVLIASIFE